MIAKISPIRLKVGGAAMLAIQHKNHQNENMGLTLKDEQLSSIFRELAHLYI